MTEGASKYTAFSGDRRIASGDRRTIVGALKTAMTSGAPHLLAFDDATGRQVDFDLRDIEEFPPADQQPATSQLPATLSRRGRPRLGVVAREVTLLPRHWDWLAQQPGGASGVLRRLVDQARKAGAAKEDARQALDAAYRLMAALAGDRSGFEDAARALYAADFTRVLSIASAWPADVADYVANRVRHAAELTNRVDLNQ